MYSLMFVEISSPNIAVYSDGIIVIIFMLGFNHVKSVGNYVRMVYTPTQRLNFLNSYKPSKVVNFCFGVKPIFLLA